MIPFAHVQILVEGQRVGNLDRNSALSTVLSEVADKIARANDNKNVTMDIIVENVGRVNTGVEFDLKGLTDPLVLLNSESSASPCRSSYQLVLSCLNGTAQCLLDCPDRYRQA